MKRILTHISIFALGLIGLNFALAYALGELERDVDRRGYAFDKYRWEEFYELPKGDSLDILFLGSSHAYRGFDPALLDSLWGIRSFNLGSSGQTPLTSLHVLRNAVQHQQPKKVVMELYFHTFMEIDQLNNGGNNWRQMQSSPARRQFLWQGFNLYEMTALTILPLLRRKNAVPYVLRKYLRGDDHLDHAGQYEGKGYVSRVEQISATQLQGHDMYDDLELDNKWVMVKHEQALRELAEFCRTKGIKLQFISSPMPQITVQKIKDRAKIDQYLQTLTTELKTPYRNDMEKAGLGLVDTQHFFDNNHLNAEGVEKWNKQLYDFFTE